MIRWHRLIPVFVLAVLAFSSTGCGGSRQAMHNYTPVPFEAMSARLSDDEKEMLATYGMPDAVWRKPFGIFVWVYCTRGSPTHVCDFDGRGLLLGEGNGGRKGLCPGGVSTDDCLPSDRLAPGGK